MPNVGKKIRGEKNKKVGSEKHYQILVLYFFGRRFINFVISHYSKDLLKCNLKAYVISSQPLVNTNKQIEERMDLVIVQNRWSEKTKIYVSI